MRHILIGHHEVERIIVLPPRDLIWVAHRDDTTYHSLDGGKEHRACKNGDKKPGKLGHVLG